ncbi:MAG: hypothetical protein ACRDPR_20820, partial [Nocardioidaceae bacterium]
MSDDRPRLAAVAGLAKVPAPSQPRPGRSDTTQRQPQTTAPAPANGTGADRTETTSRPATPPKTGRRASERSTGGTKDISFTTPLPIRTKLRQRASAPDTTVAAVVLAAV